MSCNAHVNTGPHVLFLVDAMSPLLSQLPAAASAAAAAAAAAAASTDTCGDEPFWVVDVE